MSVKKNSVGIGRSKNASPKHQDFMTYKDFTSDKSLESADFEPSFGEINGSFYSSGNDDQHEEMLFQFQQVTVNKQVHRSKAKEEETNYTSKPAMILEKVSVQRSVWCINCIFKPDDQSCLII